MNQLKNKAKELSRDFLENAKQYRLGFVEAEMSNPKTKHLGETFVSDTTAGIKALVSVDKDLIALFEATLLSERFDRFCYDVKSAIQMGRRIFISGCGATGRLAIRLESSFREAIKVLARKNSNALRYEDSVFEIMTGGDYAIIRSVESFEDYDELGCVQANESKISQGDILIGVTATGETTSILGTAKQALKNGASVWMIVCTDPTSILGRLKRADDVYTHERCNSIYMRCGAMAVTGSTRMQSSTIEQAVIGAALEIALSELLVDTKSSESRKQELIKGFKECVALTESEEYLKAVANQIEAEAALYSEGGYVTYFAKECLLDVLTDTTERSPTFSVPPFRPQKKKDQTLSWAFVKNPSLNTREAWNAAFEREPRCIDKTEADYIKIGIKEADAKRIPDISINALLGFEIGCEPDPEREGEKNLATWIGYSAEPTDEFYKHTERYGKSSVLTINENAITVKTHMKLFEHLAIKLMLNTVSTGTMAKMGRVCGNYMVHLNISNKKLVDRATRIISDLCGVDYDTANYELFYSKVLLESLGIERSTTIETIDRLGQKTM